jgi:hypothetical protein
MMLKFSEFLKEEEGDVNATIEVSNVDYTLSNIDKANEDLDAVTLNPYVNSAMFVNSVRGTLERYGIILPAHSNMQQLSLEGEWVYALGDSGHYIYMVHNLDDEGSVEGYAQIVDSEELEDLKALQGDDDSTAVEPDDSGPSEWMKYPKARRDDDSGDTAEYA